MHSGTRLFANPKLPNDNGWQDRHNQAVCTPRGPEVSLVRMFEGWLAYADNYRARYQSPIGEDGVLGDDFEKIGLALRGLLNGEAGRLDCGTLDAVVLNTLSTEGFDTSKL